MGHLRVLQEISPELRDKLGDSPWLESGLANLLANKIWTLAHAAYMLSFNHTAPIYQELYKTFEKIQPGELVCEISRQNTIPERAVIAVGLLIAEYERETEPDDAGGTAMIKYTLIRTLTGEFVEWENCQFVGLPENYRWLGSH